MTRPLPETVDGREVIFGAGLHAAIYAATRVAMGYDPPVVFEQNLATGGVFAQLLSFRMNSVNAASVESVATPGPSRVVPVSASDDLNWIPNSAHQVRKIAGGAEYPSSLDMCRAIQLTLREYAEVYTGAKGVVFDGSGRVYISESDGIRLANNSFSIGKAKRVIFAGGVVPRAGYRAGPAVMSGFDFLRKPPRDLDRLKVAIIGGGDTAAQVAEYALGQGVNAPAAPPSQIHWYGGENMPATKDQWMEVTHARWAGLARHFPQAGGMYTGVVRPYPIRGDVLTLGNSAMVNGQVYDLAVMCTGVQPALCPVSTPDVCRIGGMAVARSNASQRASATATVFKIGIAAALAVTYTPYRSRFTAANDAIYNLGPRTAALAADIGA